MAPDNGLISLALNQSRRWTCYRLDRRDLYMDQVTRTFHGRDVFAPVAAALASGEVLLEDCGPLLDTPYQLALKSPISSNHGVRGQVLSVDHFGNVVTNIGAHLLPLGQIAKLTVLIGEARVEGIIDTYSATDTGTLAALINSSGLLEVAIREGSAVERIGVAVGAEVEVIW